MWEMYIHNIKIHDSHGIWFYVIIFRRTRATICECAIERCTYAHILSISYNAITALWKIELWLCESSEAVISSTRSRAISHESVMKGRMTESQESSPIEWCFSIARVVLLTETMSSPFFSFNFQILPRVWVYSICGNAWNARYDGGEWAEGGGIRRGWYDWRRVRI